jgi:hypothetical protein
MHTILHRHVSRGACQHLLGRATRWLSDGLLHHSQRLRILFLTNLHLCPLTPHRRVVLHTFERRFRSLGTRPRHDTTTNTGSPGNVQLTRLKISRACCSAPSLSYSFANSTHSVCGLPTAFVASTVFTASVNTLIFSVVFLNSYKRAHQHRVTQHARRNPLACTHTHRVSHTLVRFNHSWTLCGFWRNNTSDNS